MPSLAESRIDVPLSPVAASEALVPVLQEQGFHLAEDAVPGAAELGFFAKRKVLRAKLWGAARITDNGSGSTIELGLDVAPNEPGGLLDGKRNRRTLDELTEQVITTLGAR
ncbi:hypothetical protein KUV85_07895 [Nocardioides panacisoli]|uniref:hypothetical protein n=1 Tax=Nocardioides panacisoli TaxID=627624 RepID=UPI001C62F469|nr:hypothetical protein [Nocardioides panacisoli]QYJ05587.1 hypothetical protein KUV85_07895 [Nocardioides panacisoli]